MCTRPVSVKVVPDNPSKFYPILQRTAQVPCGKCPECLKDRQNSWKLRLVSEATSWRHLYFFTLTYSEQTVPRNEYGRSSARVKDVQYWLKRFRTNYTRDFGCPPDFKYFICAEYAPSGYYISRKGVRRKSTERPHYHGVIFSNIPLIDFKPLFKDWEDSFGFVDVEEVGVNKKRYPGDDEREHRSRMANYISKYCCKGEFASRAAEIEAGFIERAFSLMSKGIGYNYIERWKSHHLAGCPGYEFSSLSPYQLDLVLSRRFVQDGTHKYRMPRYYSDRIYKYPVHVVQDNIDIDTGKRVVKQKLRYTTYAVFSTQISREIQRRVLERRCGSSRFVDFLRSIEGTPQHAQAFADFLACKDSLLELRESRVNSKLQTFYDNAAFRNASLAVD